MVHIYVVRFECFRWTVSFELLPIGLVDSPRFWAPSPISVCGTRALLPIASSPVLAIMGPPKLATHVTTYHYCQWVFAKGCPPMVSNVFPLLEIVPL